MELAVPLIALGGLFVASNQDNKKEGYENMGKNLIPCQIMIHCQLIIRQRPL